MHRKACTSFRKDGRVVEISGDYTETLARLKPHRALLAYSAWAFTIKTATSYV